MVMATAVMAEDILCSVGLMADFRTTYVNPPCEVAQQQCRQGKVGGEGAE